MFKLSGRTPKQVKRQFTPTESWLKVRPNEDKCEGCGVSHTKEDYVGLVIFTEGKNAHVCLQCCEDLISIGGEDIDKKVEKSQTNKEKLIKQAKRVGVSGYYLKGDRSEQELKKLISERIVNERSEIYRYIENRDGTIDMILHAYKSEEDLNDYPNYKLYNDPGSIFGNYHTESDHDHRRWITNFTATKKIGDITVEYAWASCTGDNSLDEAGFNEMDVWDSVSVLSPLDNIEDSEVLSFLLKQLSGSNDIESEKTAIKEKMLEAGTDKEPVYFVESDSLNLTLKLKTVREKDDGGLKDVFTTVGHYSKFTDLYKSMVNHDLKVFGFSQLELIKSRQDEHCDLIKELIKANK